MNNTTTDKKIIFLTNIGQLLTLKASLAGQGPRRGKRLSELDIITDAAVLCAAGKIVAAGERARVEKEARRHSQIHEIDCRGQVVLPGFVDSHTHPVFAAPRLVDFERRLAGATYEEIAAAGGGIQSSVAAVRAASREQLADCVRDAVERMARQGTTTVECKSGYGLSLEDELKSLEAIQQASAGWQGTISATLLGAHVVPKEFAGRREEYVRLVCEEMIPEAARRQLAQFVDVFCERSAFSLKETLTILRATRQHGLDTRVHINQLSYTPLHDVLALEPAALDHMDHVSDTDLPQLATSNTIATLVPAANHFLGLPYPNARKLIDAGVPVALATDFNPGTAPTVSMPLVLNLACTQMRMSPEETIAAATINGAHALRLADRKGSIEPGKHADLACFAVRDYREIPYWFGDNRCEFAILNGHGNYGN